MKKIFIDVETTGYDSKINSIFQIGGLIEIDNKVVDKFLIKMAPRINDKYNPEAILKSKTTFKEIESYQTSNKAFLEFSNIVKKYITEDEHYFFYAYNSKFDEEFVRVWLKENFCDYSKWFYVPSICIMSLAMEALTSIRKDMNNFRLETVVEIMEQLAEVKVMDKTKLHNALYDINLSRFVYRMSRKLLKEEQNG